MGWPVVGPYALGIGVRDVAVGLAAMLAFSACNGDDDAVSTTVPETSDVAATTSTTIDEVDVTTAPTTTVPTTSTTTTSTPPPPTSTDSTAPTTTRDPSVDAGVQAGLDVVEAVREAYQTTLDVVRDPESDAKLARLEDFFVDPLLQGWRNIVERYRSENLFEIENLEERDSFDVELASLAINEALTLATVQGCSVTSGIVLEAGANADGSDRVVEDGVSRTVVEFEIRRDDDAWKVASVREPDESESIASCE